jgi:membrane protein DedA with SNARE-associated domain
LLFHRGVSFFDSLIALVLAHGYIVVFVAVALDCAALPIPGELLLLTLGGLAGQGHLDPASGILAAAAGVLVADVATYWVGRLHGQRVFAKMRFGQRWTPGVTTLIFGRFVIGARVMVAPMAGAKRLPFARFVLFDGLGAMLWAAAFVAIGYAAGAQVGAVQSYWNSLTVVMQIAIAVAIITFLAVKFVGATRFAVAIGAALIALSTVRPALWLSGEIEMGGPRGKHDQAVVRMEGPEMAPHTPQRSSRPGEPVALLVIS